MRQHFIAAAMFLALAGPAAAHTSYLLPDTFWPTDHNVDIEAAFATDFFTPQIALAPDVVVMLPGGLRGTPDRAEVTPTSTRIANDLPQQGTYRFTTGEKLGRVTTLITDGAGGWRPMAEGETPAADAQTTTIQTVTVSDVYVTRGAATRDVVDTPVGRLALHPITHPDQVLAAQGFDVELLFDGQPFPNMPIVVYARGDADTKLDRFVVTDASGRAHISFDAPGQYVIAVRHRANSATGSQAAVQSYTTSLTFEVYSELPQVVEQAEERRPARTSRASAPARRRVGRQD
jgi:hypothetical protein